MPPKRGRGKGRKPQRRGAQNGGQFGSRQAIIRATGTDDFAQCGASFSPGSSTPEDGFIIQTTTAGTIGDVTGIFGTFVPIAPGTLGVRLANLGDCYAQYRVRRLVFSYVPFMNGTNTLDEYTFNNATGNAYGTPEWSAIVAWVDDPVFQGSSITATEALNYAGKRVLMNRPWRYVVRPRTKFMYQPVPTNNFSVANSLGDLRTMFTGNLLTLWENTTSGAFPVSRTGTLTGALFAPLGNLEVSWRVDLKYPADPDLTKPTLDRDEKVDGVVAKHVKFMKIVATFRHDLRQGSKVATHAARGEMVESKLTTPSKPSEDESKASSKGWFTK